MFGSGLGDDAILFLLFVKTTPEALCSPRAVALPFFKKLPKRELMRASLTPNSVRPSVHPSIPGDEQRGMMGYSPLLLSAASSRGK